MAKMAGNVLGGGTPFNPTGGGGLKGIFQRGNGGILPERGSQMQRQLVMSALQSAMTSAQSSGSPLLAFLAPMVGGAIGARTDSLYKKGEGERRGSAVDRLLAAMGGGQPGHVTYGQDGARVSSRGRGGGKTLAELLGERMAPEAAPELSIPGAAPLETGRVGNADLGFGGNVPSMGDVMPETLRPDVEPMNKARRIRSGLIQRGMPEHVADAFVMNFNDESGLDSGINEANPIVPGSRGGFGLAQWTGPRRRALERYAAAVGKPVYDEDTQLDFLMIEWEGSESAAAREILSTKDAGSAAAAITRKFLRPAEEHAARRVAKYTSGGGRVSGGGGQVSAGGKPNRELLELMVDPSVPSELRSIASTLFQQQMAPGQQVKGVRVGDSLVNPQTGEVIYQGQSAPEDRNIIQGADGFKYYEDTGQRVLPNVKFGEKSNADVSRQVNIAAAALNDRIEALQKAFNPATNDFFTREEAIEATRTDPLYSRQWEIVEGAGGLGAPGGGTPSAGGQRAPAPTNWNTGTPVPRQAQTPPSTPSMPSDPGGASMGVDPQDEALLKKYGITF